MTLSVPAPPSHLLEYHARGIGGMMWGNDHSMCVRLCGLRKKTGGHSKMAVFQIGTELSPSDLNESVVLCKCGYMMWLTYEKNTNIEIWGGNAFLCLFIWGFILSVPCILWCFQCKFLAPPPTCRLCRPHPPPSPSAGTLPSLVTETSSPTRSTIWRRVWTWNR